MFVINFIKVEKDFLNIPKIITEYAKSPSTMHLFLEYTKNFLGFLPFGILYLIGIYYTNTSFLREILH